MKRVLSILIALLLLCPISSFAAEDFLNDQEAIAAAAESVVMLTCYDRNGYEIATGSGFCAFEDGIIVTNYHVIEDTYSILASTESGMYFDVQYIVAADPVKDIAILRTKARTGIDVLPLASTSSVGKGARVVAIGSPLGLLNTVSEGLYTGTIEDDGEYILFTAAISSGSSGGALFNTQGEVIGITSASYIEGQNLNLAVPIELVKELWDSCDSHDSTEPLSSVTFSSAAPALTEENGDGAYAELTADLVDESLYDGHWVELCELIDMYLPTDWVELELTEEDIADALYCIMANSDMTAYVSIVIADADTVAEWGVSDMDELAALCVEVGYEDAEVMILNGITTVIYTDTDYDTCDIMISLDDGSVADISLYPDSDDSMTDAFVNMLCSIRAA